MKKFVIVSVCLILIFSFTACKSENFQEVTTSSSAFLEITDNVTTSNSLISNSETIADIEPSTYEGSGGGEIVQQKYRSIYYCIPAPFWDIVDEEKRDNIYGDYWKTPDNETNIMRMRVFVEEFHVPREAFDAANAEWARIIKENLYGTPVIDPKDYTNQEFDEVYNADIIYSFDNEIINEYYLSHDYPYCYESEYEKALEDGSYNTQTKEIVDLANLKEELDMYNQLKKQKENLSDNTEPTDITEETATANVTETSTTVETILPETEIQITE